MIELLGFISYVVSLYTYVVIFSVVMSWLLNFGVVNYSNPFVRSLADALHAVTEPFLTANPRACCRSSARSTSRLSFCWSSVSASATSSFRSWPAPSPDPGLRDAP